MSIYPVLFFSMIAGLATIIGIQLVLYKEHWSRNNTIHLISFAAGVLMATAVGHILPESLELVDSALIWFLGSFIVFYIIEHGLILHSCRESGECETHPMGTMSLIGIGFHSLLDGIIIGVGFEISTTLGIIAALSVLLHELPEGISTISILLHSNFPRRKAVVYSWLVALATPVGAVAAFYLIKNIDPEFLGILLAVAAGSFVYVAASDLIPEIHKKSRLYNIILLLLGVAFPFIIKYLLS